jgi:hypothetical protein
VLVFIVYFWLRQYRHGPLNAYSVVSHSDAQQEQEMTGQNRTDLRSSYLYLVCLVTLVMSSSRR